ncbi:MAG TPA: hypothetical protein EYP49_10620 [Anaerolineae bacterium]|nr:hypothetical protein [Anaerolineae bacterium]
MKTKRNTSPHWAGEKGLEGKDSPGNIWPGRLISLRMEMGSSSAWLGSAWAALCGAVASGQMELGAQSLLLLLLVLFLVDPVLGGVWGLVLGTDWSAPFAGGPLSRGEIPSKSLPYTSPGSPGYRASRWLAGGLAWWREDFRPQVGAEFLSLILILAVAIMLASLLGRLVTLLTLVALVLMAVVLFSSRRRGAISFPLRAILELGLPWLIGHLAFGSLSWESVAFAFAYTVAYYACFVLLGGQRRAATRLLNGSQIVAVALLVIVKEPILAGIAGLLLLPQLLLQPFLWRGEAEWWYLQRSQPWLMAGMLTVALAIGV